MGISKGNRTFFSQKIYSEQRNVDHSKDKIMDFLDMGSDSAPWEITKEQAAAMEGDLTMSELEDSL